MSDDLSKVDYRGRLEAVHRDGRVGGVEPHARPFSPNQFYGGLAGTGHWDQFYGGWDEFGQPCNDRNPWRIRNVAEPDIGIPMTDDIAKRMEALVRRIAADWTYMSDGRSFSAEARAIVALLPEPVDADREEAKRIAAEWYSEEAPHIAPLTAAIRRGRALERDSREG